MAHAQDNYNLTIGEIHDAMPQGITLSDGTKVKVKFISTKTANAVNYPTAGADMFKTGNGTTSGQAVSWLGGNFDGTTLNGYTGSTKASKFTTIQAANGNGIENGINNSFQGSIGVHLYFSKAVPFSQFLFLDIDGAKQGEFANKEWATAFGYNGNTYVPMKLEISDNSFLGFNDSFKVARNNDAQGDDPHGWHTMLRTELSPGAANDFPNNYGKVLVHKDNGTVGQGDADPDEVRNQFLVTPQNANNGDITDFFILWGVATNLETPSTHYARSGMSPVSLTVTPLPVSLVSFSATARNKTIALNWKAANEKDFSHFDILKSFDGKEFISIGTVGGTSKDAYGFIDDAPKNGNNYYRLKMVDKDGTSDLSRIIPVSFEADKTFLIAENPTKGGLFNVNTNAANPSFEMFTTSGSPIEVNNSKNTADNYTLNLKKPMPGLYILKMTYEGKSQTRKIIVP